jgi:hypothetical protein
LDTLSLRTASTASSAKYSLSWERIFELRVVIAIFMRSDLNLSASAKGEYNQVNVLDRILWRQHDTQEEVHSNQCVILKITDTTIYFNDASDISIFVYTTGNEIHRREDCLQENKWIVSCLQKIYSNILISKNLLLSCKKRSSAII